MPREPKLPPNERCPRCKGRGGYYAYVGWLDLRYFTCPRCNGKGKCELKPRPISPPPPPPPTCPHCHKPIGET